jgi:hypothetical protein
MKLKVIDFTWGRSGGDRGRHQVLFFKTKQAMFMQNPPLGWVLDLDFLRILGIVSHNIMGAESSLAAGLNSWFDVIF